MKNRKMATNPCQCGFFGDSLRECTCTPPLIQRHFSGISGPLLDRIDLHIQMPAVKYKELAQDEKTEEYSVIRKRLMAASIIQYRRLARSALSLWRAKMLMFLADIKELFEIFSVVDFGFILDIARPVVLSNEATNAVCL
jgi:predicted ATPase with chaperone activity